MTAGTQASLVTPGDVDKANAEHKIKQVETLADSLLSDVLEEKEVLNLFLFTTVEFAFLNAFR